MRMRTLSGIRVIIVEDEPACRDAIFTILRNAGASVTSFPNAEKAMDSISSKQDIDVVLSDLKLPGMDGNTLLKSISKLNKDIPVIIITAYGSLHTAIESLQIGAFDYILKPITDFSRLLNSVRTAAEQYKLITQNRRLTEMLKQSEETFRALFHNAMDSIFFYKIDKTGKPGKIIEANSRACAWLGYSLDNIRTYSLLDFIQPSKKSQAETTLCQLPQNCSSSFETTFQTKDQRLIPVEINSHVFTLQGTSAAISIARDVSYRRTIETKMTEAAENERQAIGKELHDVLCQDLATSDMLLSAMENDVIKNKRPDIDDMKKVRQLSIKALKSARSLATGMFPTHLEHSDLCTALTSITQETTGFHKIRCVLTGCDDISFANKSFPLHIFRITQEAVSNAVKHSKGTLIQISVKKMKNGGMLTISDNGKGMSKDVKKGIGMHTMEQRARIINATIKIISGSKNGTRVECTWQNPK